MHHRARTPIASFKVARKSTKESRFPAIIRWHVCCIAGACSCGARLPPRPLCTGDFFCRSREALRMGLATRVVTNDARIARPAEADLCR